MQSGYDVVRITTFLAGKMLELFLWPELPSLNENQLGYLAFPTNV